MRRLLILLFIIAPLFAAAQEITGVWHGHFRSNNISTRSSVYVDRYKFEVQIAQNSKSIQAVTYSYLSSIFYGKAAADGTVNVHTGKVLLQEQKLLEFRQDQPGGVCIMTCFLQYSRSGDEEFLEGTYVSMNAADSSNCGKGTVFLRKVPTSDFYEEPFLLKKEKEISKEGKEEVAKADSPARTGTTDRAKETVKIKPRPAPATTKPGAAPATAATPTTKPRTTPRPATGTDPAKSSAKTPSKPPSKAPVKSPIKTPPTAPPMARADLSNHPIHPVHPTISDSSTGIGKKFATIPPQVLRSRSNQVVKNLVVNTNEVVLNIYDDGAIDHDTVSVYLDNRQVINHAMLTDRPIILILHLDESNDYHELVMVAENEGEIPPNTSLMIVKAGDKEYEVRITSTEQKNAVVTFKFEKPK